MTKQIKVGSVPVGGGAPVSIQSMCNTRTDDPEATIQQIRRLEEAGCEIVRVAVPDKASAKAIGTIKEHCNIPLVVDIHFDYKLALECIAAGADKVRINPGNIGSPDRVKAVVDACQQKNIPIRIGVNGGSLEQDILAKYGKVCPEALVESAFGHIQLLNRFDFDDICVSLKSSSVPITMQAYQLMRQRSDYPFRVTLTADPVEEVVTAKRILQAVGLRQDGPNLISCPTCGRTRIDLIPLAQEVERRLKTVQKPITVAVMGCIVNGPGEASAADVGIAGGNGFGMLFSHGKVLKKVPEDRLVDELFALIDTL